MKVKNIVFSGFAAAILMGTAGANAATPFRIASQAYVDRQVASLTGADGAVSQLEDKVAGENETLSNAFESGTTLTGAVNELATDVAAAASAAQNAATAASAAQDAADAAQDDVDALEGKVGDTTGLTGFAQDTDTVVEALNELNSGKADATATTNALAGKVNVSDAATSIGAAASASDTKWATEKAVAEALASVTGGAGSVSQQIEDALGDLGTGNTTVEDALADKADASDVTALETTMGSATLTTTDKTVTGAINELDGDITTINTALNGKQDEITSTAMLSSDLVDDTNHTHKFVTATDVTNLATLATLMSNYATCASGSASGHCVLSADEDGLSWVDVTDPWQVEP